MTGNRNHVERWRAIRQISAYLLQHPDAKDSIEGISKWWLSGQQPKDEEIQKALDFLVTTGWMTEWATPGCKTIYRVNKMSLPEIKGFLELHCPDCRVRWQHRGCLRRHQRGLSSVIQLGIVRISGGALQGKAPPEWPWDRMCSIS